jgi:hypothetical protein
MIALTILSDGQERGAMWAVAPMSDEQRRRRAKEDAQ